MENEKLLANCLSQSDYSNTARFVSLLKYVDDVPDNRRTCASLSTSELSFRRTSYTGYCLNCLIFLKYSLGNRKLFTMITA